MSLQSESFPSLTARIPPMAWGKPPVPTVATPINTLGETLESLNIEQDFRSLPVAAQKSVLISKYNYIKKIYKNLMLFLDFPVNKKIFKLNI